MMFNILYHTGDFIILLFLMLDKASVGKSFSFCLNQKNIVRFPSCIHEKLNNIMFFMMFEYYDAKSKMFFYFIPSFSKQSFYEWPEF